MEGAEAITEPSGSLPPNLRAEHETAPAPRGPWYRTIAPAYLGLFVWAPFFDSLWVADLTRYSLWSLAGSVVIASLLCFVLFYFIPASWGYRTRQPLSIVAASTFGTTGSEWLTGLMFALAAIVWYAVAIDYAVSTTLLGLEACGLIPRGGLLAWNLGPVTVKSTVYLTTAAFWIYITGTAGLWKLPGVVVGLMRVYAPVALLLLAATAIWQLRSVESFTPEVAATIAREAAYASPWRWPGTAVQLIVGFFAMAGLAGVDSGRQAERRRDVVYGGLTGILIAASLTAILSLAVITGLIGEHMERRVVIRDSKLLAPGQFQSVGLAGEGGRDQWLNQSLEDPLRLTFRWGVYYGVGGVGAGAILILFGLAALAPACYAASCYGGKLATHWPLLGQAGWTWVGGAVALVLGATSLAGELELVFTVMGILFAPVVGAMSGDWLRQRGAWAGVRPGINRTGVLAWIAGVGIAGTLELVQFLLAQDNRWRLHEIPWWQSSALCGYAASLIYYLLLVGLGREHLAVPIENDERRS